MSNIIQGNLVTLLNNLYYGSPQILEHVIKQGKELVTQTETVSPLPTTQFKDGTPTYLTQGSLLVFQRTLSTLADILSRHSISES